MKKNFVLICLIAVILFGFTMYYLFNIKKEVLIVDDILIKQYELEQQYLNDFNNNKYTIENPKVILNPYHISPLTAIVMFKTEEEESVKLTIIGKDEKTTISHSFKKNVNHILPIYGLYADYNNKVIIEVGDLKKELTIKTEPLPAGFILPTNVYAKKELLTNDLYFVTIALKGYNAAYDINGDVRWYLIGDYSWDIQRLKNGHIMIGSNCPIASPYYTVGLIEMDLTGKIYKEYVMAGGYHHDVFEMEDGNLLVASNSFMKGTVEDHVILLNRKTGKIEKEWDLTKILPINEGKSADWDEYDWFHNNSVWYDKNNDAIILSGRHQDAVISINYDTGELNWIIGDNTNWSEKMQKYFFTPVSDNFEWQWAQHAAMVLPNGDIFILDNGNNRSKIKEEYIDADDNYTRGVIYRINQDEMIIEQVWQYGKERGSNFYSPYISDVDYLKENHYLIHSGGIGKKDGKAINVPVPLVPGAEPSSITVEILNDEVIFELQLPSNFYRVEKLSLYGDSNLVFGKGKRIGTLGKTDTVDEKINIALASKDIPKEYEVSFKKEVDRLVFSAKLLEGTKVRIILDNIFDRKIYAANAYLRAYTAMCIDLFHDVNIDNPQLINITRYINDEGLSGKYNIYLKINDKVYNTMQYVNF